MNNDSLQKLIKEGKITTRTLDRVNIAKSVIEKKYSLKKTQEEEKKKDWELVNQKLNELNLPITEKEEMKKNFLHQEAERMRQLRKKISIHDFESVAIIGRGAFGEVRVCRQIETDDIVAIKKLRKEDMLTKNQIMHVRIEKEILASNNPWIVNLKYSFQDDYYLYLVMDYLPGGDLMNLLMKKDILSEEEARFYTAEMILSVESIHKLNCIHRDLKPDNILIDHEGHIQLSDFGLSKIGDKNFFPISGNDNVTMHSGEGGQDPPKPADIKQKPQHKNRLMAFSTVGTPDYIAPEVFEKDGYGQEVDWWSIGVMFFEMVVGYPPFFSENPSDTCKKIVKWKQYFTIPTDANLSNEAYSLIKKLVTNPETRLGLNGADEIKKHPFFKGVDWENIRNTKAPFIPDIKNLWDTKYFDSFPEQEPFYPQQKKSKKRKDVHYAGYTFNRDNENLKDGFIQALEVLEAVKKNIEQKNEVEKEVIVDKEVDSMPVNEKANSFNENNNIDNDPYKENNYDVITNNHKENNLPGKKSNEALPYKNEVVKTEPVKQEPLNTEPPLTKIMIANDKESVKKISKSPDLKGNKGGKVIFPIKTTKDRTSPPKVTKDSTKIGAFISKPKTITTTTTTTESTTIKKNVGVKPQSPKIGQTKKK